MKAAALALFLGFSTGAAAQANFADRILAAHNTERVALDLPPLVWSETLAAEAAVWANQLAELGWLQHSPGNQRQGEGENLWMGTANAFTLEEMVGDWAEEKRMFRDGPFPDVSISPLHPDDLEGHVPGRLRHYHRGRLGLSRMPLQPGREPSRRKTLLAGPVRHEQYRIRYIMSNYE
jgi:hypothetical protein